MTSVKGKIPDAFQPRGKIDRRKLPAALECVVIYFGQPLRQRDIRDPRHALERTFADHADTRRNHNAVRAAAVACEDAVFNPEFFRHA